MNFKDTDHTTGQSQSRRAFISTGIQAAGAAALIALPGGSLATAISNDANDYTIQDVIDMIRKETPAAPTGDTVDSIKAGNAGNKVTGIVTTMFPTIAVIKETMRLKANFMIVHEPTFYNHVDNHDWVQNNEVQKRKQQLLEDNGITAWRCHDTIHAMKPDGVSYGVAKKAGWEKYYDGNKTLTIPGTQLKEIVLHLKKSLGISHVRVIGDLEYTCKKIILMPGAWGGKEHVTAIIEEKPDVLIVGEVDEWEAPEYIRDARSFGSNISLIVLGHAVSEEPGMEWMAQWLQPKLPVIKVTHVASSDPFSWV
jgi:putative NIF3 family GTP cyclohydrolase 1 type 2